DSPLRIRARFRPARRAAARAGASRCTRETAPRHRRSVRSRPARRSCCERPGAGSAGRILHLRAAAPSMISARLRLAARGGPLAGRTYVILYPRVNIEISPVTPDQASNSPVRDRLGRRLHDLRISVTDRCNFRCPYCMPAELYGASYRFLPRPELLSFEEIERLAA